MRCPRASISQAISSVPNTAPPGELASKFGPIRRRAMCQVLSAASDGAGAWGTYFWVDPTEKLVVVQMIQAAPGTAGAAFEAIRRLTYGALAIPDQSEQT